MGKKLNRNGKKNLIENKPNRNGRRSHGRNAQKKIKCAIRPCVGSSGIFLLFLLLSYWSINEF
jgi:hypothetical protein